MFRPQQKREFGESVESLVANWLQAQGLLVVERNYQCKPGEIDLIAKDKEQLVFVEVRYRKSSRFGGGEQSVDKRKQSKICRAAAFYLQQRQLTNRISCRFDVVAVSGQISCPDFNWIKNAFDATP